MKGSKLHNYYENNKRSEKNMATNSHLGALEFSLKLNEHSFFSFKQLVLQIFVVNLFQSLRRRAKRSESFAYLYLIKIEAKT